MKPNCTVTIIRSPKERQVFDGTILGETTSHYLIKHDKFDKTGEGAEWLPKLSRNSSVFKW